MNLKERLYSIFHESVIIEDCGIINGREKLLEDNDKLLIINNDLNTYYITPKVKYIRAHSSTEILVDSITIYRFINNIYKPNYYRSEYILSLKNTITIPLQNIDMNIEEELLKIKKEMKEIEFPDLKIDNKLFKLSPYDIIDNLGDVEVCVETLKEIPGFEDTKCSSIPDCSNCILSCRNRDLLKKFRNDEIKNNSRYPETMETLNSKENTLELKFPSVKINGEEYNLCPELIDYKKIGSGNYCNKRIINNYISDCGNVNCKECIFYRENSPFLTKFIKGKIKNPNKEHKDWKPTISENKSSKEIIKEKPESNSKTIEELPLNLPKVKPLAKKIKKLPF